MYPANRRRNLNTAGLDGTPKNLAKFDYGLKIKTKPKVYPSTDPNNPANMQKTLDKTKKARYKGANWIY